MLIPIVIIISIIVVGLIGTLLIGFSRDNSRTDTGYVNRTGKNWIRLTALYVIAAIVLIAILIYVVRKLL